MKKKVSIIILVIFIIILSIIVYTFIENNRQKIEEGDPIKNITNGIEESVKVELTK